MIQEKQLLTKDLCGRLPYGVICKTHFGNYELLGIDGTTLHLDSPIYDEGDGYFDLEYMEIQPFLRPMSSMTEEEFKEYSKLWDLQDEYATDADIRFKVDLFDWLDKKMFDYRGLIPMGLALEAPEDMYNKQ